MSLITPGHAPLHSKAPLGGRPVLESCFHRKLTSCERQIDVLTVCDCVIALFAGVCLPVGGASLSLGGREVGMMKSLAHLLIELTLLFVCITLELLYFYNCQIKV